MLMGPLRTRLAALAVFTLSVQFTAIGGALVAVCCATDVHAGGAAPICPMRHETGAACPMHHDAAADSASATTPDGHGTARLTCHCRGTAGLDALVGAVGIVATPFTLEGAAGPAAALTLPGDAATNVAPQVSAPPPRIRLF
jgi:hypothetical protein